MKNYGLVLSLLFVIVAGVSFAEDEKAASIKKLTDEQIDAAFDDIFAKQKKLTRIKAKVVTEKKGGGVFKKSVKTWGIARAQMPDRLLFTDMGKVNAKENKGNEAIILIDGVYLWDIKPVGDNGVREVERININRAGNRDINIAALLVEGNALSTEELRKLYNVQGVLETYPSGKKSYHFTLKTIPGKEIKKRSQETDVWTIPGEVIPWKIKSIRKIPIVSPFGKPTTKFKTTESTKWISELESNLSKPALTKYPSSVFYIGEIIKKNPGIIIKDSKGNKISGPELKADLKAVAEHLQK